MLWDIRTVGAWHWYAKLSSVVWAKQIFECILFPIFGKLGDDMDNTVLQVVSGSLIPL